MAVHGGAVPAGLGSPCPCLPHSCSHGAELALALLAGCPALCPAPCPAPALRQWPAQGTVSIRQKRLPALGCRSGFVVIERLFSGRRRVFFFSFFFSPLSSCDERPDATLLQTREGQTEPAEAQLS